MKYLSEYRNEKTVKKLLSEIQSVLTRDWMLMEICGGQTHSLVKNGILNMLPDKITMVHGPGCPVCVTPVSMIDKAVDISLRKDAILCSFGDMIRVPGSKGSLLDARAKGGNLHIVYSPIDAVKMASENSHKEVIFFAVGFETTAPANALSVIQASKMKLANFSILTSHVLVPPAMDAILDDEFNNINGFLAAGHVCTVMGLQEYYPLAEKYNIPIVVTGFEPLDLLHGILLAVRQLEEGKAMVENQYSRVVQKFGNMEAQAVIKKVFEISDREWRGIGVIPQSGYRIRKEFQAFDAENKFKENISISSAVMANDCIAGEILRGLKKPIQCAQFGNKCIPTNPMGAPMVSTEGACAAYYHYNRSFESILP